jgi:hypothetical protein
MGVKQLSSASAITGSKSNKFWDQSTYVGDYVQIASAVVDSSGANMITFNNIPQTFSHLQLRGFNRSVSASTGGMWGKTYFNGDVTTANYYSHNIYGQGASATSSANGSTVSQYSFFTCHTGDASWGSLVMDVIDYSSVNKYKTSRFLSGYDANGTGYVMLNSELWMNTVAVSSISIDNTGANFAQYSRFALYGVK